IWSLTTNVATSRAAIARAADRAIFHDLFLATLAASATPIGPDGHHAVATEVDADPGCVAAAEPGTATRTVCVCRLSRRRSARISEACWYRRLRSFSSALSIINSNPAGSSGLNAGADAGAPWRMESKTAAEVSPRKGSDP